MKNMTNIELSTIKNNAYLASRDETLSAEQRKAYFDLFMDAVEEEGRRLAEIEEAEAWYFGK